MSDGKTEVNPASGKSHREYEPSPVIREEHAESQLTRILELYGRMGLTDSMDMGLKLHPAGLQLDAREDRDAARTPRGSLGSCWASVWDSLGWYGVGAMLIFTFFVIETLMYVWKRGALDWNVHRRARYLPEQVQEAA